MIPYESYDEFNANDGESSSSTIEKVPWHDSE